MRTTASDKESRGEPPFRTCRRRHEAMRTHKIENAEQLRNCKIFAGQEGRLAPAILLFLLSAFCLLPSAYSQMSRKPSPTREPAGAMDKTPDSKKNSSSRRPVSKLTSIRSPASIIKNTQYALPHSMFVIDRQSEEQDLFRQFAAIPFSQRFSSRDLSGPAWRGRF